MGNHTIAKTFLSGAEAHIARTETKDQKEPVKRVENTPRFLVAAFHEDVMKALESIPRPFVGTWDLSKLMDLTGVEVTVTNMGNGEYNGKHIMVRRVGFFEHNQQARGELWKPLANSHISSISIPMMVGKFCISFRKKFEKDAGGNLNYSRFTIAVG